MTDKSPDAFRRLGAAFAVGGDRYERLRPGYPAEAVDWLTEAVPAGAAVADLGAGTGKFTAALAGRGLDVAAVDPSDDMLARLRERLPAVRTQVGTGEATGLPDRSVDLVTFAQSWHWVEPVAGLAEIARILVPGGTAAWIWNFLDVRVDWVAALAEIWHTLTGDDATRASRHAPALTAAFTPVETLTADWLEPMEIADLAALVTTRSYYLTAPPDTQLEIRARADAYLAQRFPGRARIDLPYRTHCFRARLR